MLSPEQINRAANIYHSWQETGTDGSNYEQSELFRSVNLREIQECNYSLVPSRYIRFIDNDLNIDFESEMKRIQENMRGILADEKDSQRMLAEAFRGIDYEIE